MITATISAKGQLVIPSRFRQALHLHAGDKHSIKLDGEKLILQREPPRQARVIQGKFGRPVLVMCKEAPSMTPTKVKAILNEDA